MAADAAPDATTEATRDAFLRGRLELWQPARGARATMDPLLLAHFAWTTRRRQALGRVLDLGCGTGVIALALGLVDPAAELVGVEVVPELAGLARRNSAAAGGRLAVVEGDLARRDLALPHAAYDTIVANPPYVAHGRGLVSPVADRAAARSETACTLADVVEVARRKLEPRGRFLLVLPAGRVAEAFATLAAASFVPLCLRFVHSFVDAPARRVLITAGRGARAAEVEVAPPLFVHTDGSEHKAFTAEAAAIVEGEWVEGAG
jgi:tRNA1Val (adenine37-N6)-methyltransferase